MPFDQPTLKEMRDRIRADMAARFPGFDPEIRRSVLGSLADVMAGAVRAQYGYLDWIARQAFPNTAQGEHLDRWASVWGLARKPAAYAAGGIVCSGTDGSVIPTGAMLQSADGQGYVVQDDATIGATGNAFATVRAAIAGAQGNLVAGSEVSFISPVAGVQPLAVVDSGGIAGGTDLETDTDLSTRILARIQTPPQGGAESDYVAWALEVEGVTRAWAFPEHVGPGSVGVTFVLDNEASIIPNQAKLDEVAAHIAPLRPVTAEIVIFAPVERAIDYTLTVSPNTSAVRTAAEAGLADYLRRQGRPSGTLYLSHMHEAISLAPGETDHAIQSPVGDIVLANNEIPVMGEITWT